MGNPFGFTMGRNYRFFANMKFQQRKQLARELEQPDKDENTRKLALFEIIK